jgi:hypothetical protein
VGEAALGVESLGDKLMAGELLAVVRTSKCKVLWRTPRKSMQFRLEILLMYSGKDGRVVPLFKELFPFGGQLEEDNRWLRIADLIPWRELEREYNTHFSHLGRPPLPLSTV